MTLKTSLIITGDSSVAVKAVEDLKASVDQLAGKSTAAAAPVAAVGDAAAAAGASAKGATADIDSAAESTRKLGEAANDTMPALTGVGTVSAAIAPAMKGASEATGTLGSATDSTAKSARNLAETLADAVKPAAEGASTASGALGDTIAGAIAPAADAASEGLGGLVEKLVETASGGDGAGKASGALAGVLSGALAGGIGIAITLAGELVAQLIAGALASDQDSEASAGLTAALQDLDVAQGRAAKSAAQSAQAYFVDADAKLQAAIRTRELIKAELDLARSRQQTALNRTRVPGERGEVAALTLATVTRDVDNLTAQIASQDKLIGVARQTLRTTAIPLLKLNVAASLDPATAAVQRYEAAVAKLDKRAADGTISGPTYRAELTKLTQARDAATAAAGRATAATQTNTRVQTAGVGATRDAAGATSAAATASGQLAQDLATVIARFDPARKAANDYADELERIDRLEKAGSISADQAEQYRGGARAKRASAFELPSLAGDRDIADETERARAASDDLVASIRDQIAARMTLDPIERALVKNREALAKLPVDERNAVLATVDGLRAQLGQLEHIHAQQEINLGAVRDMRDIVAQSIFEGPQSIAQLPERLLASFKQFSAEMIAEDLFGDIFRDMRDQVLGANKVDAASNQIVASFGRAATAADRLAAAQSGAGTGVSLKSGDQKDVAKGSVGKTSDIYADGISKVLGKIGIGANAAKDIGTYAGKGLAGAMEGQMAAGVASMLGIKTNSTGAAIGGALGAMSGIPGGQIIGGLLGGVVGNMFVKPKAGTATLSGNDTAAGVSGNAASARSAATSLAGAVQQGVAQIAEQLGGQLGDYRVSIGTFDGKYRVSTTGFAGQLDSKTARGQGLVDFGKDGAAAATAFAIQDAIADGAITGLSPKVAMAIRSSTDIDKALKEAMKVQELELTIGGIGALIDKQFRDFEATAKERVRVATQYGFDVLAIEQRNADDRKKLAEQLVKQQVGGLQQLIAEMTSGSLFEGSAIDRIAALNDAIAKAQTDLAAGVEGAGDKLASLYQDRLTASRDAYGTTAAYAADRSATIDEARAAIARANAQIAAAQSKSDPALATTNASLDENNEQNARLIAAVETQNSLIQQILANRMSGNSFDLESLARI